MCLSPSRPRTQVDDNGNILVTGYTDSDVDVYTRDLYQDIFIVKISASKSILWERLYGGDDKDRAIGLEAKRAWADVLMEGHGRVLP